MRLVKKEKECAAVSSSLRRLNFTFSIHLSVNVSFRTSRLTIEIDIFLLGPCLNFDRKKVKQKWEGGAWSWTFQLRLHLEMRSVFSQSTLSFSLPTSCISCARRLIKYRDRRSQLYSHAQLTFLLQGTCWMLIAFFQVEWRCQMLSSLPDAGGRGRWRREKWQAMYFYTAQSVYFFMLVKKGTEREWERWDFQFHVSTSLQPFNDRSMHLNDVEHRDYLSSSSAQLSALLLFSSPLKCSLSPSPLLSSPLVSSFWRCSGNNWYLL